MNCKKGRIMKKYVLFIALCISGILYAQTAEEVFTKVNTVTKDFSTMYFEADMKITSRGRTLTKSFVGYLDDQTDSSFMEYTNSADEGTRYLKLKNDMWIYLPDAGDVLKLSGHLLRDSMMGSDISYDDMMNQGDLSSEYYADSVSTVNFEGKDVFLLTIKSKEGIEASYIKQELYIDKNNYNVYKITMFAEGRGSDRAIKEFIMRDYKKIGNLTMATEMEVIDLRKKNSKTVVKYTETEIDIDIDKKMFTRAYLEN